MRSHKPLLAPLFVFPLLLVFTGSQAKPFKEKLPWDLPPVVCLAKASPLHSPEGSEQGPVQIKVMVPRILARQTGKKIPKRSWPKVKVSVTPHVLTLTIDPKSPAQLRGSRVLDLKGKPVSNERLLRSLRTPKPILLSLTGRPVDPFFLQVVRRQTMVILLGPRDGAPLVELFPRLQRAGK